MGLERCTKLTELEGKICIVSVTKVFGAESLSHNRRFSCLRNVTFVDLTLFFFFLNRTNKKKEADFVVFVVELMT